MIVTNLSPINQLKCVKRGSQVEYSYSDTNWWNKINSSIFNQRDKIWSFLEHQESSPTDGIEAKTGDDLNFAVEHFWILNTGCGREELEMTLQSFTHPKKWEFIFFICSAPPSVSCLATTCSSWPNYLSNILGIQRQFSSSPADWSCWLVWSSCASSFVNKMIQMTLSTQHS